MLIYLIVFVIIVIFALWFLFGNGERNTKKKSKEGQRNCKDGDNTVNEKNGESSDKEIQVAQKRHLAENLKNDETTAVRRRGGFFSKHDETDKKEDTFDQKFDSSSNSEKNTKGSEEDVFASNADKEKGIISTKAKDDASAVEVRQQKTGNVIDLNVKGENKGNTSQNSNISSSPSSLDSKQEAKTENRKANPKKPGKPCVRGHVLIDSVTITWEPPSELLNDYCYQIRIKEVKEGGRWTLHPEQSTRCSVTFSNLKSDSSYVFQVRMVNDDEECMYSEISDPVVTIQSAAHHLLDFMTEVQSSNEGEVQSSNEGICLKQIPLEENIEARNETAKTRRLTIGKEPKSNPTEKTIMLVGATGAGKSTLVDGMINYILGVSWNDPYRLKLVNLEEDEKQTSANQAKSQTQWITCYTINHVRGSRLDYTLNIIDTPGFGDTRGIEQDKKIIEQIRELFSRDDKKGILFIDAVCFIVKAPDARLTPTQIYIFNSILSLFGQDIKDNFCMLVTFADGKTPPVLAALKEAELPHEHYHPFNNSGLFAENAGDNVSSLSQIFWDMGCKSFQDFFRKLTSLETKSLLQTRDVLKQRRLVEVTMENLLPKLDAGLNKVEELRLEIKILEENKTEIEANSNFTYTITETQHKQIDLPPGQHVTNCLTCHRTCHKVCFIANDADKRGCAAMGSDGNCTQCPNKCFWNIHRNTPYIFEYVSVQKEQTYTEKLEKYRRAQGEKMTREKVVERMNDEVCDLEGDIMELMEKINECNNILRKIALKPDPLSVVEHIDLLIESEKGEKRAGYNERIAALQKCRKEATIEKEIESFMSKTKTVTAQVNLPKKERKRKGFFSFLGL